MHRPELARDPLVKEFVDSRRGQAIASSEWQHLALQPLLDLQRQAVHAAPHVGMADRQPHPHPRGNRDHRPDNALTTAAANPVGIEAGMRTRALPANSISIAGVAGHPAPSPTGAIST